MGVILNRGRYVVFLGFLPCFLLMLNCERVLLLLGQDADASRYA